MEGGTAIDGNNPKPPVASEGVGNEPRDHIGDEEKYKMLDNHNQIQNVIQQNGLSTSPLSKVWDASMYMLAAIAALIIIAVICLVILVVKNKSSKAADTSGVRHSINIDRS